MMDMKTALSAVIDQIKTVPSKQSAKSKTTKKQKTKAKTKSKSSDNSSSDSDGHLETKSSDSTDVRTSAKAKAMLNQLIELKSFAKASIQKLDSDSSSFYKDADTVIKEIISKSNSTTFIPGIRTYINRICNECNSLIDGLSDKEIGIEEIKLSTIDDAIAKAKSIYQSFLKKEKKVTKIEENTESIYNMISKAKSSRLHDIVLSDKDDKTIINGISIMLLGSFSAKLLKKYFKSEASSGYPIIYDQSVFILKNGEDSIDSIEEYLDKASNSSAKYVLVSRIPKFYSGYIIFWIMTQHQLDTLKRCAAYQDYMMLKNWDYL